MATLECINGVCRRRNRWFDWGRWAFLGLILIGFLIVFFLFACIARRRRRRGAQPMYGTGWMAPNGKYGGQDGNYNGQPQQGYGQPGFAPPPPPAYGQPQYPQPTGTTGTNFHPNDGYYGDASQQYGVQHPPTAYQPNSGPYSPPPGPPPGK
ncbi:hypothetical protein XA68_18128 [Ophiocordyceps unilateralis]|uniref:Chitin synthesis regulation, Congo red resistance, RCR protein n=1 Tax=Ophiocordyceps unilateralis TaxID=268505 RepID=A0A2A9P2W6_OPHUN|nr:hypothetical protein XA68_18128 [Ophiocordyceps unilateralis]